MTLIVAGDLEVWFLKREYRAQLVPEATNSVGIILVVIVHITIVKIHVPRVVATVLSGRPVVVRLGGSPDGLK